MHRFAAAHAPDARVVLVGHTHRAGVERVGGRTIINTGCFGVPGPALGVLIGDDGLTVRRLIRGSSRARRRWRIGEGSMHADPTIRWSSTAGSGLKISAFDRPDDLDLAAAG
jgi:hypothetical protein